MASALGVKGGVINLAWDPDWATGLDREGALACEKDASVAKALREAREQREAGDSITLGDCFRKVGAVPHALARDRALWCSRVGGVRGSTGRRIRHRVTAVGPFPSSRDTHAVHGVGAPGPEQHVVLSGVQGA